MPPDDKESPQLDPQATLEETRLRIEMLARDIQALRDQIPETAFLAILAQTQITTIQTQLESLQTVLDRLAKRCEFWVCDIGGRYTFLLNLREWLAKHTLENAKKLTGIIDGQDDSGELAP